MEGMEDEEKVWKMEDMETGKIRKSDLVSAQLVNFPSDAEICVLRLASLASLQSVLKLYKMFPDVYLNFFWGMMLGCYIPISSPGG
jgi:hypothetical protein